MDTTNLDAYGNDALPWSRAERQATSKDVTHFLTTVRADGRPHVAGIGRSGARFYFTSGDERARAAIWPSVASASSR